MFRFSVYGAGSRFMRKNGREYLKSREKGRRVYGVSFVSYKK